MRPLLSIETILLAGLVAGAPSVAMAAPTYTFTAPIIVNDEVLPGIASSTESSGGRTLATFGENVYAAWADGRVSPARVYFARSPNRGASWGPNVAIADSVAPGAYPAIAVSPSGRIWIAWQDFRTSPLAKVHVSSSVDGGDSFGPAVWASASLGAPGWDGHPCIAGAAGDTVHVAWLRHLDFESTVYVATSTDGGESFGAAVPVESRCRAKADPVIVAAPGGMVTVAWADLCDSYQPCGFDDSFCGTRIYRATSFDGGTSFEAPLAATPLFGPASSPALAVTSSGHLLLAWSGVANRGWAPNLYFARDPVGGTDYTAPGIVDVDLGISGTSAQDQPSLATTAGRVYVGWRDARLGGNDVYFAASDNGGLSFGTTVRVNEPGGAAVFPSVAVSPENVTAVLWSQADSSGGRDTYAARGAPTGTTEVAGETQDVGESSPRLLVMPNPGRAGVRLSWSAGEAESRAAIYDVSGRRIGFVTGGSAENGRVSGTWDGRDASGRDVSPGIYYMEVEGPGRPMRTRFVLVR